MISETVANYLKTLLREPASVKTFNYVIRTQSVINPRTIIGLTIYLDIWSFFLERKYKKHHHYSVSVEHQLVSTTKKKIKRSYKQTKKS